MTFGEYIKNLRIEKGWSQRELASKIGITNAAISRLESSKRKKPSLITLNAIAQNLGISQFELLKRAGYMDDLKRNVVDENICAGENGVPIDIVKCAKDMYEKDSEWASLAFRVAKSDLSEWEMNLIKTVVQALLEYFQKEKSKQREHM
jgi:HTH-type transcriptional regulator, competence development regulator